MNKKKLEEGSMAISSQELRKLAIYQFSCNSGSTTISQESTLQANGNGNGDGPSN